MPAARACVGREFHYQALLAVRAHVCRIYTAPPLPTREIPPPKPWARAKMASESLNTRFLLFHRGSVAVTG